MSGSSPRHSDRWAYPLLLRLHFYAGLLVGPFIVVAALSGALFAVTPQLEAWLYQSELTTAAGGTPRPLAEQIAVARSHIGPDAELAAVRPAPSRGETTRVMFAVAQLPAHEHQAMFVDPVTLAVQGSLPVYGTSGSLPLRIWIDYLHRQLHLGEAGRYYSELAASWLWLVALGGLALWWRRRRRGLSDGTGGGRLRHWHGTLGAVIFIALLFFSVTGLTWSKWAGANIADLRAWLDWGTPGLDTRLTPTHADGNHDGSDHHDEHGARAEQALAGDGGATWDAVLTVARQAGIDAGKVEIKPGVDGYQAWVVQEIDRRWPTQVDQVAIDPHTMSVTSRTDFSGFPLAAKLTRWGIDAHMGILFGLPNQLFVAACALSLCVLIVLGYRIWWRRRPRASGQTRSGEPVGHWLRRVPPAALLTMAGITAALGFFAPVMGVSLLLFLLVDAWRTRRSWRRQSG